ncbi:hypothetical protein J2741_002429 [Methanolinea mesophila]|nr:hypothetical protein [Methanolinea mesophila]MBP1929833.1 hypothetical protein [Methanolinea mesophila]
MWECHHDLCRAVFPVLPPYRYRERGQMAIVAEEEPPYFPVTRRVADKP